MSKLTVYAVSLPLLAALCLLLTVPAAGQELRATLFTDADALISQGKELRSDLLAPKSWGKGMEKYSSAERKLTDGKNLEDIRKELTQASGYFRDAIKATELAKVTMASYLKARDDAAKVDAAKNDPQTWERAEVKFFEAGRELEEGDINNARKRGAEAEALYRDAELAAIKTSFFDETRKLLTLADDEKVEKFAPTTLAQSRSLLAEAEKALNDNRYDNDRPRSLAMEAKYQALHALHLAKLVKMTDEKVMSREELILEAEKPMTRIAGALDVQAGFEEGFTRPTETIIGEIEAREAEQDRLTSELRDRDDQIASLTAQVSELVAKLGGESEAKKAMQAQMDAQEQARRQFAQVEQKFTREEARIMRESGTVIIRLVGMNFASGKAVIQPDHFALLTKVKEATAIYPDAMISIEGYTDAYGTDESNLTLSQARANAVAQYLLANSNLAASNVEAIGFGETNPIANNETKEGRARNRRIDIVIKPAK